MPDTLDKHQLAQIKAITTYIFRDPLTGTRFCIWCRFPTPENPKTEKQLEGEYLCPQCQRWQHDKAWPDGIPGLTQVSERCEHCNKDSEWAPNEEQGMKRCPHCRQDMHPEEAIDLLGVAGVALPQAIINRVMNG